MFNLRPSSLETINGIGESACKVQLEGALILEFVEEQSIVKLDRVLYVPDLGYNLFSPVAAFDGVTYDKIGGPEKIMTVFGGDVVFRLGSGSLLSSTAHRIPPSAAPKALSAIAHCKEQYVDKNDFHRIHAHAKLMLLRATAK